MRRFVQRLTLLLLPTGFICLLLFGSIAYIGEVMPLSSVVNWQANTENALYGPINNQRVYAYKQLMFKVREPGIIVIGSSRAMQFREEFFNRQPSAFYNAAGMGWSLREVDAFLRNIPENQLPEIVLLAMDQPWFTPAFIPLSGEIDITANRFDFDDMLAEANRGLHYVLEKHVNLTTLLARTEPVHNLPALGLHAIVEGQGIRNDGSIQRGDILTGSVTTEALLATDMQILASGQRMYVQGDTLDAETLSQLDVLLDYLHQHDIQVIGFTPPFNPQTYQGMVDSGQYTYLNLMPEQLTSIFGQYGYVYVDYTDPASLRAAVGDFWDGWHASERLTAQLYLDLFEHVPEILDRYTEPTSIQAVIDGSASPLEIFED